MHPGDPRPRRASRATGRARTGSSATSSPAASFLSRGDPPRARADELGVVADTEIGGNYGETLARWRKRFRAHLGEVRALGYDERFVRTWDFYLASCEARCTGLMKDAQLVLARCTRWLGRGTPRAPFFENVGASRSPLMGNPLPHERRRRDRRARRRSRGRIRAGIRELSPATWSEYRKSPSERRAYVEQLRRGPIALQPGKPNEQHYEEPPAFFELVLGPRLKYSSCLWEEGTTTLADAEGDARAHVRARGPADGMEVLDLGCGWGSLTLYAAERYPGARSPPCRTRASSASGSRRVRPPTSPSSRPT